MLDNIRELSRQLRLSMLLIDNYVPPEHQDQIEQRCRWDEQIGEWHIEGLQYTGNIMQKTATTRAEIGRIAVDADHPVPAPFELDLEREYLKYGSMVDEGRPPKPSRPKTAGRSEGQEKKKAREDKERRRKKKEAAAEAAFPSSRPTTGKARFA
jgi:kinesin family protein 3/17